MTAPNGNHWPERDLQRLRQVYATQGRQAAIDLFPERSRHAVIIKLNRALEPLAPGRTGQLWTNDEVRILREVYPAAGGHAVQRLLPHRSMGAIYQQAQRWGLEFAGRRRHHKNARQDRAGG